MTQLELAGMKLEEALALLEKDGVQAEVIYAMPSGHRVDESGRSARVVRFDGKQLLVSLFRDGMPEGAE